METSHEFLPAGTDGLPKADGPIRGKKTVIKSGAVRLFNPQKIKIPEDMDDWENGATVHPMIRDGEIIGFVSRCSCGKVTEILLEFDENRASVTHHTQDETAPAAPEGVQAESKGF